MSQETKLCKFSAPRGRGLAGWAYS